MEEYTPETIALKLFSEDPKPPSTNQLQIDEADDEYVFEMLISIFMEGIETKLGDLKQLDTTCLTTDLLLSLNPYILSLGFNMTVNVYASELIDSYNKYYCKIILNLPENFIYFKNNVKNYTFALNRQQIERDNLASYYAIFQRDKDVFVIKFDYHIPDVKAVVNENTITYDLY